MVDLVVVAFLIHLSQQSRLRPKGRESDIIHISTVKSVYNNGHPWANKKLVEMRPYNTGLHKNVSFERGH